MQLCITSQRVHCTCMLNCEMITVKPLYMHTLFQLGHASHQMITSSETFITMAMLSKRGPQLSVGLHQLS